MSTNPSQPFHIDVSSRISRLPPYLFARINKLKYEKRVLDVWFKGRFVEGKSN